MEKGYKCPNCGTINEFSSYVYAHWNICIKHTCACRAVNVILKGRVIKPTKPVPSEEAGRE